MKKLIALLPLLLLGACADWGYSPGAWAGYDPSYDWGYSGYQRPIIPQAYDGPYMGPPPVYPGSGYAPAYDGTWYEGPGYGPY